MSFSLAEVQHKYLEMISDISHFCESQGIRFFMAGGTLLGAVREHGFIPWDDDVDFAMPRPDYCKFLNSYHGHLQMKEFLLDSSHLFPYMKLYDSDMSVVNVKDDTTGVESDLVVSIDIYPIDGLGSDIEKAKTHFRRIQLIRKVSFLNMTRDVSTNPLKRVGLFFIRRIPTKLLMRMQVKQMSKFDFEESSLCTRWRIPGGRFDIYDKNLILRGIPMPFEHQLLYAPAGYDAILRFVYGDYLRPLREDTKLRHSPQPGSIQESFALQIQES